MLLVDLIIEIIHAEHSEIPELILHELFDVFDGEEQRHSLIELCEVCMVKQLTEESIVPVSLLKRMKTMLLVSHIETAIKANNMSERLSVEFVEHSDKV